MENRSMQFALLEPCRGLAALWVFFFHHEFSEAFRQAFPTLHKVMGAGDLGVPMFFVVSGYCITASARSFIRRDEATAIFMLRRLKRIYPPYWFSMIGVCLIPFAIQFLSSLKAGYYTGPDSNNINYGFLNYSMLDWFSVATLTRVFFEVPGADSLQYKFTSINAVYWTLAIEVQFYLVAGIALVFRKRFVAILLTVTALSLPFIFIRSADLTGLFLPYWPMFAMGIGLYFVLEKGKPASRAALAMTSVMIATLVVWLVFAERTNAFLFSLYFGIFLYFLAGAEGSIIRRANGNVSRVLLSGVTVLGAMSYSLYLLHGRLQGLVAQVVSPLFGYSSIASDIAVIVLTVVGCYAFHLVCERPFIASRSAAASGAVVQGAAT